MKFPPAPIRFLLLVVGGWVAIRAAAWLPSSLADPDEIVADGQHATPSDRSRGGLLTGTAFAAGPVRPAAPTGFAERIAMWTTDEASVYLGSGHLRGADRRLVHVVASSDAGAIVSIALSPQIPSRQRAAAAPLASDPIAPIPLAVAPPSPAAPMSRLSGSAWLFLRDRGAASLAQGGTLGGSQAGARLLYRLNGDAQRPLGLSARLYAPVDRPAGAEAAVGIDWRPIAGLPINLLVERRQRIGREGRSDFALTAYGGIERRILRDRVRIEAYGQAGIVGINARDLFADGQVTATTRIGPVDVGGGAWGGAQPGAARLDLGPHASFRLPIGQATIRAAAEWRFRVAGDAEPGSGPALTISAGF